LLRALAAAAGVSEADCVLEVGTGAGTLTRELLEAGAGRVVTVEVDRRLPPVAREVVGEEAEREGRVRFVEGDVLAGKTGLHPGVVAEIEAARADGFRSLKLVANLPYAVATPLIVLLLEPDGPVRPPRAPELALMAVTVQREVAERLAAERISKEYGVPSVLVQALARVEVLRWVGPKAFWPAPKVRSAMVRMVPLEVEHARVAPDRYPLFRALVRAAFQERRKTLRNSLRHAFPDLAEGHDGAVDRALAAAGIDPEARVERLSVEAFVRLAEAVEGVRDERKNGAAFLDTTRRSPYTC
jgi:16S rRNA (adenine1518-N6/adenine1519-N6)-dimethyltransferase